MHKPSTHLFASQSGSASRNQGGFTLIELMVGALLGMLTVIVISQVLIDSEEQRRKVAMGGDSDINGSLALFTMQRDIQMAGYGMGSTEMMGCSLVAFRSGKSVIPDEDDPHPETFILAPVIIANGTDGAPDTITVVRGETVGSSVPMKLATISNGTVVGDLRDITTGLTGRFNVESSLGVHAGDQIISVPTNWTSTPCHLLEVTHDPGSADSQLTPTNIPYYATSLWNTDTVWNQIHPSPKFLVNMGRIGQRRYFLNNTTPYTLRTRNLSSVTGTFSFEDLYPEIVNLQALYGKDLDGNGSIDRFDTTTPTTGPGWAQVVAVRIALVARNPQFEKDEVTVAEPLWEMGKAVEVQGETLVDCGTDNLCVTLKIDSLPDWKHYRYKVYSTTIPLRNILWTK